MESANINQIKIKYPYMCSKHFNHIVRIGSKSFLPPNAVPTINQNRSTILEPPVKRIKIQSVVDLPQLAIDMTDFGKMSLKEQSRYAMENYFKLSQK